MATYMLLLLMLMMSFKAIDAEAYRTMNNGSVEEHVGALMK